MYFPIRCFSCGAPIAQHWEEYEQRVKNGEKSKDVMDDLGIKRICCRRMFLSHVDVIEKIIKYEKL